MSPQSRTRPVSAMPSPSDLASASAPRLKLSQYPRRGASSRRRWFGSSGPFYEPEENKGGQDLQNHSCDDRMASRRVVSVAQNDHEGNARALQIYSGASTTPSNPATERWLWRLPWAAYVDSSYAREVKMQGWECLGYSGTWLGNPFDTDELDTGNYIRFARHDTGSTPFGCIYHGFHPLLDSVVSIDHTVSP